MRYVVIDKDCGARRELRDAIAVRFQQTANTLVHDVNGRFRCPACGQVRTAHRFVILQMEDDGTGEVARRE